MALVVIRDYPNRFTARKVTGQPLVASALVSGPSQASTVTEPDDESSLLADRLLEELDTPRSGPLAEFVRMYVRRPPASLTENLAPAELAAQVRGMFEFVNSPQTRRAGGAVLSAAACGRWVSDPGSVVDVNIEDAPFLVDTVTAELHTHGLAVRVVVHPVIGIERAEDGRIRGVTPARGAERRESVMHFEIDRALERGRPARTGGRYRAGARAICDWRCRDFLPMVDRVERMIEVAGDAGARFSEKEIHESVEFLQWLTDDNFIYLGYREYEIQGDGGYAVVSVVPESGLGIMSDPDRSSYCHRRAAVRDDPGASWADARRPAGGDLEDQSGNHHPSGRPDGLHRGAPGVG